MKFSIKLTILLTLALSCLIFNISSKSQSKITSKSQSRSSNKSNSNAKVTDCNTKIVKVVQGSGICDMCSLSLFDIAKSAGFDVSYITASEITNGALGPNIAAVMFGGGDDPKVLADALKETGMNNIKNYIQNGGKYFGVCMSGFFAGNFFYNPKDNNITYPGLALYPGYPNGLDPLPGVTDANASRMEKVAWKDKGITKTYDLYYQDGPSFVLDNPNDSRVDVVGRYRNNSIASLFTNYGNGRVFVTGPHPEAPEGWFSFHKICPENVSCAHTELAINALRDLVGNCNQVLIQGKVKVKQEKKQRNDDEEPRSSNRDRERERNQRYQEDEDEESSSRRNNRYENDDEESNDEENDSNNENDSDEEEFTSIKTKDKSGKTNKSKTTSKIHQKERKGNEHKQNLNDKGDREDDRSADDNEDESLISLKTKTKSKKPSSSNNAHDFNSWTQLIQVRLNKIKKSS